MFYSQFILAKKGPLGTIWIAAHLERKLRKNQVADTDIGVSVDSILFPDVPIALRLSSHLLLGVVRIYSRKVNYLFHDCSEALLKVKQAFRSTAVDLPPEESTAPYHSITLPETFDLDDFELPDSEFFHGNYVDHHVSTREQITLQDTMDGVVYSTSQFGLDERFGDGDTSQIGLDLDEDLFLDKVTSPRHTAVLLDFENVDPQASDVPMTPFVDMDIDEDQNQFGDEKAAEASEVTAAGEQIDSNTQDQKKAEDSEADMVGCSQAPSTPGLAEKEISTNDHVQDGVTCNLQPESECQDSTALVAEENLENLAHQLDLQITDTSNEVESSLFNKKSPENNVLGTSNGENGSPSANLQVSQIKQQGDSPPTVVAMDPISSDLAGSVSSPTSVLVEQAKPVSPASEGLDRTLTASNSSERAGTSHDGEASEPLPNGEGIPESDCILQKDNCEPQVSINVTTGGDLHEFPSHVVPSCTEPLLKPISTHELENNEGKACSNPEGTVIPSSVGSDKKLCQPNLMLRACNSLQKEPDLECLGDENLVSALVAEEALHASETSAVVEGAECQTIDVEAATTVEPIPSVDVQANLTKSDECLDTVIPEDNRAESLDCPANSDLPAPEILLSAPAAVPEVPHDLLVETLDSEVLTAQEGNVDESNILSGKKRRLMESTPILPDDSSAKLSRSKRTLDSVPDDDDLLSSILVGRRSSILKLRPTPSPLEIAPSKRPRVTPRGSLAKRKVVLLDDTMVLHGDTIRQQLTNTEDVRRVRRKAPCTRPEIWVIQKHLLEDEIFSEPLFTGMPADMVSLYNGTYDLSEVKFAEDNGEHTPVKSPIMEESSRNKEPSKEDNVQGAGKLVVVGHDGEVHVPSGALVQTESQLPEEQLINSIACENQDQAEAPTDIPPVELINTDQLGEVSSMEVDKLDTGVADTTAHASTDGIELPVHSSPLPKDNSNEINETEAFFRSDKMLDKSVEKDILVTHTTICKGDDVITVAEEGLTQVEGVSIEKDGSHIQESDNGGLVDAVPPSIPQENQINVGESSSIGTASLVTEDSSENRTYETVDASIPMDKVNPTSENMSVEGSVSAELVVEADDHAKEGFTTSHLGVVIEDHIMAESVRDDGGNFCPILNSSEQPQRDSLCSLEINGDAENAPLDEREHPGYQEANLDRSMDAEAPAPGTAVRDSVDFGNTVGGNDTGFLNFDDDEVAEEEEEEEENGMPDSVEARFLENSGWSSRTRAVAKYLQTLFENESGQPRKTIPVDNLLSGKTRKEASRMFFETLVLKTRDYIHVEQVNPFDNINIKPRVKLMKADF